MPYRSSPRNHFIFIVSQAETLDGEKVGAYAVLEHRLAHGIWALNKHTRHRKEIQPGAKVVFYVAGTVTPSKCFVASADVSGLADHFERADLPKYVRLEEWLYDIPVYKVTLSNIEWFREPVDMRSIWSQMDLFKDKGLTNWGILLQGGARAISEADYDLIISRSSHQ